uniref:Uncharacterized protein n=1 Tax=Arundo donax TaxID=35708 RepID=A0A0A9F0U3_ARUDO
MESTTAVRSAPPRSITGAVAADGSWPGRPARAWGGSSGLGTWKMRGTCVPPEATRTRTPASVASSARSSAVRS